MRDCLLIFVERLEQLHAEDFLAEVPLIERLLEHGFIQALQFSERELLRQQLEAQRFIPNLRLQSSQTGLRDGFVIEGELRQLRDGKPSHGLRIRRGLHAMIRKLQQRIIRDTDHALARISVAYYAL